MTVDDSAPRPSRTGAKAERPAAGDPSPAAPVAPPDPGPVTAAPPAASGVAGPADLTPHPPGDPTGGGHAAPYAGGDPYADYHVAAFAFADLVDLADRRLGGGVVAANDEFFADRENLLNPWPASFDPQAFGPRGKVMDGWETRRRRGTDATDPHPASHEHDWALIRLGTPGLVHGVIVDTAHFRGNHPQQVSVEAANVSGEPSVHQLTSPEVTWTTLVPRGPVLGHAANAFPVRSTRRYTHLRLNQFPDGGIARLRVHGEVVPDPTWLAALSVVDLAALENGGVVEDASDRFYSPPQHIIFPGRSRRMDDGWENRRRRGTGHDWVRLRLAGQGIVRAIEIDTGNYKGNAPGWAALHGFDAATGAEPTDDSAWFRLLDPVALRPDARLRRYPAANRPVTHVRIDVLPDGGIARLRLHGTLTESAAQALRDRWRRS